MADRMAIYAAIDVERARQERLKAEGRFDFTCADPALGHLAACAVLTEEVGEVARAVMGREGLVRDGGDLRKELVQVAAVAIAWLEALGDGL